MAKVDTSLVAAPAAVRGIFRGRPRRDPERGPLGPVSPRTAPFSSRAKTRIPSSCCCTAMSAPARPRRPASRSWCATSRPAKPSGSPWRSACSAIPPPRPPSMTASCWPGRPATWPRLVAKFPALATNTLQTVGARLQETHTRVVEMSTAAGRATHRARAAAARQAVRPQGRARHRDRFSDQPAGHRADDRHDAAHGQPDSQRLGGARAWSKAAGRTSSCANRTSCSCWPSKPRKPVQPRLSRDRRRCEAQRRQKFIAVDAVLAAGVIHGVKLADRATDASHPEIEEDADGGRPSRHDLADRVERSGHVRLYSCVKDARIATAASLSRHKLDEVSAGWSGFGLDAKGLHGPRSSRAPDGAHRNGRQALPPGFALPQRSQGSLAT